MLTFLPIEAILLNLCAAFWCAATLGADVMHGQFVVLDLGTERAFDLPCEGGELDVGDLSATVAEQVVVRLGDLVKAIGNAVDM